MPELNNILGWIEQLSQVDTDGVEPLTAVIDQKLRLRDDVVDRRQYPRPDPGQRARSEAWLFRGAKGDRVMVLASVRAKLVEGLLFNLKQEGQGFDRLNPNGFW